MSSVPSTIQGASDFLTNKEKQAGILFTIVAIAVGIGGVWLLSDVLLGLLKFAIGLIGGTIAIGAATLIGIWFVMLLMNPRTYTELYHWQARTAAWVSRWAMKSDPFGRMRAFADEFLGAQFKKFNDASVRLEAQLTTVKQKIAKHSETLQKSNTICQSLENRHLSAAGEWSSEEHRDTFRLESQRILLTEDTLKKLRSSETRLTTLVKIVDRWRNTFKFEIESVRMSAEFLEMQYNEANDTAGALEAASSAFGSGDMAAADKEVRTYIEQLTATRIAQADVLMKQIPELTSLGELKGDIAEDQVMARLRQLDTESQNAYVQVQAERRALSSGSNEVKAAAIKEAVLVSSTPAKRTLLR